jgi:LysM repeat protein
MRAMKSFVVRLFFLLLLLALGREMRAQSLAGGSEKSSVQLEALTKKIDEQNTKIDALSQQLLKLEHQIAAIRPGVMIGETTPSSSGSTAAPAPASSSPVASVAGENAHVVTKGETLTSIAKANRVGVQELQKFNHIENDRALQIGQTIMIPPPGSGSPAPNE